MGFGPKSEANSRALWGAAGGLLSLELVQGMMISDSSGKVLGHQPGGLAGATPLTGGPATFLLSHLPHTESPPPLRVPSQEHGMCYALSWGHQ